MIKAPEKLNGYPVIASSIHSNGYVTVMVERKGDYMPFVVATWYPELKSSWLWGHYSDNRADADKDFQEAQTRNTNRG